MQCQTDYFKTVQLKAILRSPWWSLPWHTSVFTSRPHQELAGMACSPNVPETSTFLCHGNQVDNNTYRLRILDPLKGQLCEFMNLKKNPVVFSSAVSVIRKHFTLF